MNPDLSIIYALILPLIGAIGIALAGQRNPNLRETITLATAVGLMVIIWNLLPIIMGGARPSYALTELLPGISIAFKIEPLGMIFTLLASLLWVVNSVYSIGYMRGNNERHQTRFYICFAIAISAVVGIAFSANLLTLLLFYEILTFSTYPLVAHKGDAATVKSARIYFGILIATSIGLLLPAIIWTYHLTGTLDFTTGGIMEGNIAGPIVGLLLALYVFGIGKAAIMPVHRWLPSAMVAPTPVSALLHAVAVVKAGVFTLCKVIIYIFGTEFLLTQPSANWLLYLAAFTIIMASLIALKQTNLKRLLAYSTIAQLSYIIMAIALFQPMGEIAASLHIVAHGFAKITLFFAAGSFYIAARKTEIIQLQGIGRRMPWTMAAFTIGALSMIGIPLSAGFVSKWYLLMGAFQADSYIAISTVVISTLLNALYFLPIIYIAWFKAEDSTTAIEHGEAPLSMVIALVITASLTTLFFFYHQPVFNLAVQIAGGSQ